MKYSLLRTRPIVSPRSEQTWRPWTLRKSYFISFIILCILLCIAVEVILHACHMDGCHVFGKMSTTAISRRTNIAYNLAPTAISLCLGLVWVVTHHDIMRLEPYFQMSAEGGASAADSLFLEYSYTFPLLVPFKAGRRRHYVVLLSSCILLLMNFMVTPLIGGIFDDTTLCKSVSGYEAKLLLHKEGRPYSTTSSFEYVAYSYRWFGRSLPPFTDPTYALLPVVNTAPIAGNETWSASTTLYGMNLTCDTAVVNLSYPLTYDANSRIGGFRVCDWNLWDGSMGMPAAFVTPWSCLCYYDWYQDYSEYDGIEDNGTRNHVIAWASGAPPAPGFNQTLSPLPIAITALSCNTSFYSRSVNASFEMPSGKILGVNYTDNPKPFLHAKGFGESLYWGAPGPSMDNSNRQGSDTGSPAPSTGSKYTNNAPKYTDNGGYDVGLGYVPLDPPNTDSQLRQQFGGRPDNTMTYSSSSIDSINSSVYIPKMSMLVAFALHNQTDSTLPNLLDPHTLEKTFEKAFQLLFAFWVSMEMVDTSNRTLVQTMRLMPTRGFEVNWWWARGVQAGLVVVVAMTVALVFLIGRRSCELDGEPNSLAEGLRLLSMSEDLSAAMENAEFHPPEEMLKVLSGGGRWYKLELIPGKGPSIRVAEYTRLIHPAQNSEQSDVPACPRSSSPGRRNPQPWIEKLWILKTVTGVGFVLYFVAVLTVLIAAFIYSRGHKGLPNSTTTDSFGYKVPFSYLPLAVSMSMEPILVTLGSCHSMLSPYKALTHGEAPSSKSLTIDYDKSPPHMQLLRSLRTGNIVLATITAAILLSNVLAIALSGLFSPTEVEFPIESQVYAPKRLEIKWSFSNPGQEMKYILAAGLLGDIPPLNWTTPEYYVLPFQLAEGNVSSYEGPTFGIGIGAECKLLTDKNLTRICVTQESYELGGWEESQDCNASSTFYKIVGFEGHCGLDVNGNKTDPQAEGQWLSWDYGPFGDDFLSSEKCPSRFFPVWGELPANPHPNNPDLDSDNSDLYQKKIDAVMLDCTSWDMVVNLNATVDKNGRVISVSNVQPLKPQEVKALYFGNKSDAASLSATFVNTVSESVSMDDPTLLWFNYLMVTIEKSIVKNLTNLTHIPDTTHLAETFGNVYRQLFAINLRLYEHEILSIKEPLDLVSGEATFLRGRVNMNYLMFIISVAIVLLAIVVIVVFYWWEVPKVPGHLPITLAGVYALLYASNAKGECGKLVGVDPYERAERMEELDGRYAYGLFEGKDGRTHFGIYRQDKKNPNSEE